MCEPNVKLNFYSLFYQMDESHAEIGYVYIGEPLVPFRQIVDESKEEFEILSAMGRDIDLDNLIQEKLLKNGYQKVKYQDTHFGDEYYGDNSKYYREDLAEDEELQARLKKLVTTPAIVERIKEKFKIPENDITSLAAINFEKEISNHADDFTEEMQRTFIQTKETQLHQLSKQKESKSDNPFDRHIDEFIDFI